MNTYMTIYKVKGITFVGEEIKAISWLDAESKCKVGQSVYGKLIESIDQSTGERKVYDIENFN